jgi:hypothetical protein
MAWSMYAGTINPGQTHNWGYWWNGYHGVQWVRARPTNPGSKLRVFNHADKLNSNGSYTYYISVRNDGSYPVHYYLVGDNV